MKTLRRLLRRPLRLDRISDRDFVFDLEFVHRALKDSMLVARLTRKRTTYVARRSR